MIPSTWARRIALALALAGVAPPAAASPTASSPSAPPIAAPTAPLASSPEHRLEDEAGETVARFVPRDTGITIDVPPGRYVHVAPDGRRTEITIEQGERFRYGAPSQPPPEPMTRPPVASSRPEPTEYETPPPTQRRPSRTLRRPWVAPLIASFVPGSGHALVRESGAAIATFAGAVGLTFGAVALGLSQDEREGATIGAAGRSPAAEAVALGSFVAVTDALALLWIGQAADAWRRAKGRVLTPRTRHVVAIGLSRASTVGLRPGEPAMARYEDISLSLLGQVRPRLAVGVADLSVFGGGARRITVQAGLRIVGRAVERDRFWLVAGGGVLFQGTGGRSTLDRTGDGPVPPREPGRFGAVVYAQLEARFFALDRLSLDVGPRLSVPLSPRFYGGGKAIARYTPTLELVAGPQVYF